jgi:hypothetical protein
VQVKVYGGQKFLLKSELLYTDTTDLNEKWKSHVFQNTWIQKIDKYTLTSIS